MSAELPEAIGDQIDLLCRQGDAQADQDGYAKAIERYDAAWALLPEPKTDWNAATWILTAIGDTHFLAGEFASARDILADAMRCPDAIGNPFIHLRLGQARLELGEPDKAADELMRAYMGAGAEIFDTEDPKYLAFLSTRAKL